MVLSRPISRKRFLRYTLGAAASVGALTLANLKESQQPKADSLPLQTYDSSLTLKHFASKSGLLYGAASGYQILSTDSEYAQRFAEECLLLVPENDLKWRTLRPSPGEFDFFKADWLMDFATRNGLMVRGHALVFHHSLPDWFDAVVTPDNAEQFLTQHIKTVVNHFKGNMHSWDVVNEAIHPEHGQRDNWRLTPWYDLLGPEYVELAFRVAAEADPNVTLVYNDNRLSLNRPSDRAKRSAVLRLLERLKANNVPVHALGIQGHLTGGLQFDAAAFREFLRNVADLDLKIMITELDVIDQLLPADIEVRDRLVSDMYRRYLDVVMDEPAVISVVNWGLSDRYTWISRHKPRQDGLPARPLPIDAHLNRKAAWNVMAQAFEQRAA